jgi:hypothetical protein
MYSYPIYRSKAVANGALAWFLDNSVTTRVNKYHYGVSIGIPYVAHDPEMEARPRYMSPSGEWRVNGAWSSVVKKVGSVLSCVI